MTALKFRFETQDYQTKAVQSVVDVFEGQGINSSEISALSQESQFDLGLISNKLRLSAQNIDENIFKIRQSNHLISHERSGFSMIFERPFPTPEEMPPLAVTDLLVSIEMETGTGKTYVFLKTIFELNKQYGFQKFVIVVPSIAIREGVMKSIEIMREHFAMLYQNVPFKEILYDSKNPNALRSFAESNNLSLLIINIDAFAKDENKINQAGEKAFAPMTYLAGTNPIVIIDEAQNFETDNRKKALKALNPLCQIFYSATHKNAQNLLYSLNPVEAYRQGLVKKIEVNGNESRNDQNSAYLKLLSIKPDNSSATFEADKNSKDGVKRGRISLKFSDDLFKKTQKREAYKDGYELTEIGTNQIGFANGVTLSVGETQGGISDDMMRVQIERTIAHHFEKAKILHPKGIKVLSLFFIDKVANYRSKNDQGERIQGKFSVWFEEIFQKYAKRYPDLIPYPVSKIHDGYFAGDKKGNWKDSTERGTVDDNDTYALIMRDKERLLRLEEPLQFIFSHSALREGWDNPNVFQICTLNETQSQIKKRQEIGRGLRLCVNQKGERIRDERINILTIIPNESYEKFAQDLQDEIGDEIGLKDHLPVQNAKEKVRIKSKPLTQEEEQLLHEIWERINYQASYRVALDREKLQKRALKLFADFDQYPKVRKAEILSQTASFIMRSNGKIETNRTHQMVRQAQIATKPEIPNIYAYLQERVDITRASLCYILKESNRLGEFLDNPQGFLDMTVKILKTALSEQIKEGIKYERNGKRYEISLLEDDYTTWRREVFPDEATQQILKKTLLKAHQIQNGKTAKTSFKCVPSDSVVENNFATECSADAQVKFFFKLPRCYKIKTPLGNYNPDWAVIFEQEERVYFVAETKSSLEEREKRGNENFKIECGKKFFALAKQDNVHYKVATSLEDLRRNPLFEA